MFTASWSATLVKLIDRIVFRHVVGFFCSFIAQEHSGNSVMIPGVLP